MLRDLAIAQLMPMNVLRTEPLVRGRNSDQHRAIHSQFADASVCAADGATNNDRIAFGDHFLDFRPPVRERVVDVAKDSQPSTARSTAGA